MNRIILAALIAALATGCATRSERIAAERQECAAYGYTPGTAGHVHCVQANMARRDAQRQAASAAMLRVGMYYSTPVAQRGALIIP